MRDLVSFLKYFEDHPWVFVVLYKKEILYINKSFREMLGFSEEDIKNMTILDLIKKKSDREYIKSNIEKRLKGEVFAKPYKYIELVNKKNERFYANFYSQTIKIDDEYMGLAIGFDSTEDYKKEFLIDILKEINQAIISKNSEEEIFTDILNEIYERGNYVFVCVFVNENKQIHPKYCKGFDKEFLNFLKDNFVFENREKCPGIDYLLKNEIMVVNDVENIKNINPDLYSLLSQRNANSLLFIPIYNSDKIYGAIGIVSKYKNDFDELSLKIFKEAKQDLEFSLKKIENHSYLEILKRAIDKTFAWVLITDENANIIYANEAVEKLSGYKLKNLLGKNPKIFKSGYHSEEFYEKMWENLKNNIPVEALLINKSKNGKLFYLKDRIVPVITPSGKKYYISLGIDITQEYNLKDKLKKDILTNLPNRSEFINIASKILKKDKKYACVVIDITDFKIFNQIYGNESGDFVLKEFAKFLKTFFYENDVVARIGGDEFAVLFEVKEYTHVEKIMKNLIEKIKNNDKFRNKLSVNIGISLYPKDDTDIIKLLEKAIFALQIAKEKGDFSYEFFDKLYDKKIIEYYDVKNLIIKAIRNDMFIYHFQPYVDSKTFEIVGAETLLRIKDGDKIIYPGDFIEFLENSNYIKEVEKLMFPKYIKYLKQVKIPLSFNISGRSLTDMNHIKTLFARQSNLPIVIELTEREIALNIEYTKSVFNYFKSKNIKVSIDDFGTGYSSLTYLKDLPADYLKIDMSFVKNIVSSKKDRAIVETIVHFAHNFDLKTIAEGVETIEQVKILQEMECDYLQGYYFYKPMEFGDLLKILK